jgi:hypothetical protein
MIKRPTRDTGEGRSVLPKMVADNNANPEVP